MQVRDILYVDDLVDAFLLAQANMPGVCGQAFNIGGGPANTISLLQLLDQIEHLTGRRPGTRFGAWRPGDQRYYVSDTRKMKAATGWLPRVNVEEGVRRLHEWLQDSSARKLPPSPSGRNGSGPAIDQKPLRHPGSRAWADGNAKAPDVETARDAEIDRPGAEGEGHSRAARKEAV